VKDTETVPLEVAKEELVAVTEGEIEEVELWQGEEEGEKVELRVPETLEVAL
jgi:hypothetical protein